MFPNLSHLTTFPANLPIFTRATCSLPLQPISNKTNKVKIKLPDSFRFVPRNESSFRSKTDQFFSDKRVSTYEFVIKHSEDKKYINNVNKSIIVDFALLTKAIQNCTLNHDLTGNQVGMEQYIWMKN